YDGQADRERLLERRRRTVRQLAQTILGIAPKRRNLHRRAPRGALLFCARQRQLWSKLAFAPVRTRPEIRGEALERSEAVVRTSIGSGAPLHEFTREVHIMQQRRSKAPGLGLSPPRPAPTKAGLRLRSGAAGIAAEPARAELPAPLFARRRSRRGPKGSQTAG